MSEKDERMFIGGVFCVEMCLCRGAGGLGSEERGRRSEFLCWGEDWAVGEGGLFHPAWKEPNVAVLRNNLQAWAWRL